MTQAQAVKTVLIILVAISPIVGVVVLLTFQVKGGSKSTSGSGGSTSGSSPNSQPSAVISLPFPSASPLPSQAPLPPPQDWCSSRIFCPGPVLQTVDIANLYLDQKTFVDKPTSKSSQAVLDDFQNISSTTYGEIATFLENDFAREGQELQVLGLPPSDYTDSPPFLDNIVNSRVKSFAQVVHKIWPQLVRATNVSALRLCDQCERTFLPLNHNFVIPAGTFRERYYSDSFWIAEGLLSSNLISLVNDMLQNFMDELDRFNFIPCGGRTYFLNRSQPPLFIQMLNNYVQASGDRSILARALPLAEREMQWWDTERSIQVKSPNSGTTFKMYRYNADNSAPRPESYLADYLSTRALNGSQKTDMYAELASLSESGWNYSTRWVATGGSTTGWNVRNIIGPDLNSIIYKNHITLVSLYGSNAAAASPHTTAAELLRNGILDLLWDPNKLAFYDFNLITNRRNTLFTAAAFYPFWAGIFPDQVANDERSAFRAFASINMVMNRYNGTFPATFYDNGPQYDYDIPVAWPPHQYIALQALRSLPPIVTINKIPLPNASLSAFTLIPSGQLGRDETELPVQPIRTDSGVKNAVPLGPGSDINNSTGTVTNGGYANVSENWSQTLQRELANRYYASVMCSWFATGGKLPTASTQVEGHIYEKFSTLNIDSGGQDYTAQVGFGWTNGVLLWVARNYGKVLADPICPT